MTRVKKRKEVLVSAFCGSRTVMYNVEQYGEHLRGKRHRGIDVDINAYLTAFTNSSTADREDAEAVNIESLGFSEIQQSSVTEDTTGSGNDIDNEMRPKSKRMKTEASPVNPVI